MRPRACLACVVGLSGCIATAGPLPQGTDPRPVGTSAGRESELLVPPGQRRAPSGRDHAHPVRRRPRVEGDAAGGVGDPPDRARHLGPPLVTGHCTPRRGGPAYRRAGSALPRLVLQPSSGNSLPAQRRAVGEPRTPPASGSDPSGDGADGERSGSIRKSLNSPYTPTRRTSTSSSPWPWSMGSRRGRNGKRSCAGSSPSAAAHGREPE